MIDRNGYRPNVGIILLNSKNEVFWGKRIRQNSWQFPQGGIKSGKSTHPEFDAWRWNQYWVELDSVVEFKRKVYKQALTELSALLHASTENASDR